MITKNGLYNCCVCQCTVREAQECAYFQRTFQICESKTFAPSLWMWFETSRYKKIVMSSLLRKLFNSCIAAHSTNNSYVNWTNNWFGFRSSHKYQQKNDKRNHRKNVHCLVFVLDSSHMNIDFVCKKKDTQFWSHSSILQLRFFIGSKTSSRLLILIRNK